LAGANVAVGDGGEVEVFGERFHEGIIVAQCRERTASLPQSGQAEGGPYEIEAKAGPSLR